MLLQLERLWRVVDGWLAGLSPESFVEMLPLVRRAFVDFSGPERRQMGEVVARRPRAPNGPAGAAAAGVDRPIGSGGLDPARLARVRPVLAELLGRPPGAA